MTNKPSRKRLLRQYTHLALQVLLDIALINLSFLAAMYLRYEKVVPASIMMRYTNIWPVLTLFCLGGLLLTKTYKCLWRFANSWDVLRILVGTLLGVGATYVFAILVTAWQRTNTMIPYFTYVSRLIGNSVRIMPNNFLHGKVIYGIAFLIMFLLMTGQRFGIQFVGQLKVRSRAVRKDRTRRVMVVGAGWAGAAVIRELIARGFREGLPVVAVDDDPAKAGTRIMGIPIEFGLENIPRYVEKHQVVDIVIAIPSASNARMREIMQLCAGTGCKLRMVNAMQDVTGGAYKVSPLRDVNIADLLCREEVRLDIRSISEYLSGKTILVTGGGGSIGSELCRQIAQFSPGHLVAFDIYENNAYELQQEMKAKYGDKLDMSILIGSVRDTERLDQVMQAVKPHVVFHAAAHKHVPLMEESPAEAVKNNIFGTLNLALAADRHGVDRMVILSTDKAVNPTNVMGATKRVCELIIQYMARRSKTRFMAVRFGNVLGSNGSVIPLFKKQISMGGPVTVTHPDMKRYFMTIPEASQLVLQAGAIGESGSIFVLDMGTQVKIVDLARNLIQLAGFKPDEEIKIDYCGLRAGEKLYEELAMNEEAESLHTTCHDKIMVLDPVAMDEALFLDQLKSLKKEAQRKEGDVYPLLKALVPTFIQKNTS